MQQDEFASVQSDIICSDSPKGFKTNWIMLSMQVVNDLKHTSKVTQDFFKGKMCNVLQWPRQSPDLNLTEHVFHFLKGKMPQIQAGTEHSCRKGLKEHHQGSGDGDVSNVVHLLSPYVRPLKGLLNLLAK